MTFAEFIARARAIGVADDDVIDYIDVSENEFGISTRPDATGKRLVALHDHTTEPTVTVRSSPTSFRYRAENIPAGGGGITAGGGGGGTGSSGIVGNEHGGGPNYDCPQCQHRPENHRGDPQ